VTLKECVTNKQRRGGKKFDSNEGEKNEQDVRQEESRNQVVKWEIKTPVCSLIKGKQKQIFQLQIQIDRLDKTIKFNYATF
jgi:hypothetical protein